MDVLYVALGGAVGSALRYLVDLGLGRVLGAVAFPVGTFTVNVLGSILLGVMLEFFSHRSGGSLLRLTLTTGMIGGFTTYSSFNLQVYRLFTNGDAMTGGAYLSLTVVVCLGATAVGVVLTRLAFT